MRFFKCDLNDKKMIILENNFNIYVVYILNPSYILF